MNFFEKYKKILLIVGFLGVCFVMGYLLYAIFFKPAITEPEITGPQSTNTANSGQFPDSASGKNQNNTGVDEGQTVDTNLPISEASEIALGGLTKTTELTDTPSLKPTLGANGADVQYYDKEDGKFYSLDKNGELSPMSDKVFYGVENVTWANDKDKAILEYPDGSNILYNFQDKKQISLPKHWKDFDFDPASDKIVMKSIGTDPDNRWLAVANADGSKVTPLEALGDKDETVYPSWSPSNQVAAMFTESRDFDRQEVYFVGLNKENFKSTIVEGRGFDPKWAPTGKELLYSVYSSANDMKPTLWLVNADGDTIGSNRKKLNLDTWASKCTYANENELYCAVPDNLPEGAGLFPELAQGTKDTLYKIDTRTGSKKIIAIPDGNFNISNIMVSENGYNLFFTDEGTERIHKIKLK